MASVRAGMHKVSDLLAAADFDFASEAAAEYLDGQPDHRRVKVGGLSFDSVDQEVRVPVTANEVEIELDGAVVATLDVELDEEQQEARRESFETSAVSEEDAASAQRLERDSLDSRSEPAESSDER